MTLQCLQQHWPRTWRAKLSRMFREGFVLCLKCDGLPHEKFLDAHNAACPNKENTMHIHWRVQCPCKLGPLKGWITVGGKTDVQCANCGRTITVSVTEHTRSD